MSIWKEFFRHCNFDRGSKGIITAPTKASWFPVSMQHWAVAEVCTKEMKQRYHEAPCPHPVTCLLWALEPVSPVMLVTRSPFYWRSRRKRSLGKFLQCNSDSGGSVPSKPRATNRRSEHSGEIFWRPVHHQTDGVPYAPFPRSKPHLKNSRKKGHDAQN